MPRRVFLVTGMSGTGVRRSLDDFQAYCSKQGQKVVYHSVEGSLIEFCGDKAVELHPAQRDIMGVLLLPKPYLRIQWERAFNKILEKVNKEDDETDVFITFHSCFYHQKTQEYLSMAKSDLIKESNAELMITFIDDIYDSQHRLCSQFFPVPRSLFESIDQLLRILDWRSKEILLSEKIAHYCGIENGLFAVKHPAKTLFDYLYSNLPIMYLSHPITEPRQMLHEKDEPEEAERIMQESIQLADQYSKSHVVFEPTTIDELRFDGDTAKLTERWPIGTRKDTDLIWCKPEKTVSSRFVFPWGWNSDERTQEVIDQEESLMQKLRSQVQTQINSRDHKLVEQVDLIAVFRPLYRGKESGGVKHEYIHVKSIVNLELKPKSPSPAVILNPPEDTEAFPPRQVSDNFLEVLYDLGTIIGDLSNVSRLKKELRSNPDKINEIAKENEEGERGRLFQALLQEFDLEVSGRRRSALDPDEATLRITRAIECGNKITEIYSQAPYFSITPDDPDSDIGQLVRDQKEHKGGFDETISELAQQVIKGGGHDE